MTLGCLEVEAKGLDHLQASQNRKGAVTENASSASRLSELPKWIRVEVQEDSEGESERRTYARAKPVKYRPLPNSITPSSAVASTKAGWMRTLFLKS